MTRVIATRLLVGLARERDLVVVAVRPSPHRPGRGSGRRTEKVVSPGELSSSTRAAVRLGDGGHDRQAEAGASTGAVAGVVATGEPLEHVGLQRLRHAGPVVVHADAHPVALGPDRVTTVVPSGVWVRALASRLATTWCRRALSPVTSTGLVGQVELPPVVGGGGVGVADRVDHHHRQVDRLLARGGGRRRGGRAGAGPRRASSSGRLGLDAADRVGHRRPGTGSGSRRVSSA